MRQSWHTQDHRHWGYHGSDWSSDSWKKYIIRYMAVGQNLRHLFWPIAISSFFAEARRRSEAPLCERWMIFVNGSERWSNRWLFSQFRAVWTWTKRKHLSKGEFFSRALQKLQGSLLREARPPISSRARLWQQRALESLELPKAARGDLSHVQMFRTRWSSA